MIKKIKMMMILILSDEKFANKKPKEWKGDSFRDQRTFRGHDWGRFQNPIFFSFLFIFFYFLS
jgi:hypothetical protein